jgi:hypothetical protein
VEILSSLVLSLAASPVGVHFPAENTFSTEFPHSRENSAETGFSAKFYCVAAGNSISAKKS